MLTIEELIASETAKAKEYKAQADFGWDYFTHKKLSYLEQRRNAFCAERHNQIAELLRELAERRKVPEIIHCCECSSYGKSLSGKYMCLKHCAYPQPNHYCADGTRRVDDVDQGNRLYKQC